MTHADPRTRRKQRLIELFDRAPIKKTFGMVLSYAPDGRAQFELPHNPGLEHAAGDTHGGVLATLIDNAAWFTAALKYDRWIATVELTVRLHEPARREPLRAAGRLVRAGRSLAVAEAEVRSASGRLVATGAGTFKVTSVLAVPEVAP